MYWVVVADIVVVASAIAITVVVLVAVVLERRVWRFRMSEMERWREGERAGELEGERERSCY